MKKHKISNSKLKSLKETGTHNKKRDKVACPIFQDNDFFDPNDLVQVKYEMIRSVKNNECSAKDAAEQFGFSRVSYYKIQGALNKEGLQSLIPKKRGPQGGHKLTPQIDEYIKTLISNDQKINTSTIVTKVKTKFSVELHTRTVYRYLSKLKKNGQTSRMKKK